MSQKQNWEKIIYLAEDDEDDRLLFADAVDELNLPILVVLAADGCELLETLEKGKHLPEMIFLDINMPRKNGFECLKEIRNGGTGFKDVKIVMLSTSSSAMHVRTAYNLGADYYAVKPATFMELKDLLRGILDKDLKSLRKEMEKNCPPAKDKNNDAGSGCFRTCNQPSRYRTGLFSSGAVSFSGLP